MTPWHRLGEACWNMRALACLMVGPAFGLALVGAVFGLSPASARLACIAAPIALAPFALLVRAEYARLSDARRR